MNAATNTSAPNPSAAHLRVVSDRGVAVTPGIQLSGVSKIYRSRDGDVPSLRPLDFHINTGEFFVVVGPSGCGKSTLLKMISGLLPPSSGEIFVEGEKVDKPHGNVGIVFQNSLLLPWRNVLNNVMLPIDMKRLSREEYLPRASALLKLVGLEGFEKKLPWQLSGGMQQRASICRALVHDPKIILMDEPFGALDAMTRERMNVELMRIQRETGKTVLLITHSIPEAVFLADRVLVMTERPGAIAAIYDVPLPRPRSLDAMADPVFSELVQCIRKHFFTQNALDRGPSAMPRLVVRNIDFFERGVCFSRPFRFGAVVVTSAPQLFVRVEIEVESGKTFVGASAEMLVPKWFDKRAHLSADQTVDELRRSLEISRELYLASSGFDTAFGHHVSRITAQIQACAREDIPSLAAILGPAEIDKAIIDALLRSANIDFFKGMTANIAGIDARLVPDLRNQDVTQFLAQCRRLDRVAIRHTVGIDDAIEGEGGVADVKERAGARYFKLKLAGDPVADAIRLIRIGKALAKLAYGTRVTLDANEQYSDFVALQDLVDRLRSDTALEPIASRLLYIEQPMPR